MKNRQRIIQGAIVGLAVCAMPAVYAADEWHFGVGTGISSFSLDGDIGFATTAGGVIADIDLDNSDTSDMLDSAFGFSSFATNGEWTFNLSYKTVSLEDDDSGLDAEWDRTEYELSAAYQFAETGNHRWGVLAGVRGTDHEWDFSAPGLRASVDEDWTDVIIGLTHAVPINDKWSWSNRADYGFGDTEGSYSVRTAINWQPYTHWVFNGNISLSAVEYGEKSDVAKPDFYYYDVDEPAFGLGFAYVW